MKNYYSEYEMKKYLSVFIAPEYRREQVVKPSVDEVPRSATSFAEFGVNG